MIMFGWYVQKPRLWVDLAWSTKLARVFKRKFCILNVVSLCITCQSNSPQNTNKCECF